MASHSREAVEYYHSLLKSVPGLCDRTRDQVSQRLDEVRFVFGGRMLSPYLRPHFIDREQFDYIKTVCDNLWLPIARVGEIAMDKPELLDYMGVTDVERQLMAADPKFRGVSRTSRLDSFLTENAFQFVELNAETPAGVAYSDIAAEIFSELEIMATFRKRYEISSLSSREKLLAVLVSAWKEFCSTSNGNAKQANGNGNKPGIAIVDYAGLPTHREFELVQEFFEGQGFPTIIADPRELEFTSGRLHKGAFQIDIVYKRVLVNEFLEKVDECKALLDACVSEAVCMVNPFRGKLIHKKLLFGVLTDERFAELFSEEERRLIDKHVPWTRRLEDRRTVYKGQSIDMLEFARKNRDRLVLKPNDEYGGKGIFIGWNMDEGAWDAAIGTALSAGDYLLQEKVITPREEFPYIKPDGEVEFCQQLIDLDPLLFDGKVGSAFTRLSTMELANVTAGGGMVPVFVIERKF